MTLWFGLEGMDGGPINWTNWVGRLICGDLPQAGVFLGIATFSFAWIARNLQREGPQRVPDRAVP